jgi:hypothetical protein
VSATLLTPVQFRVVNQPTVVGPIAKNISISIDDPLASDRGTFGGDQPAGARVTLPVVWSPYIRITGDASLAGRDREGMVVARVDAARPDGRWAGATVPATPWPLAVGRAISALSLAVVLALAAVALVRRLRRLVK